MHNNLPPEMIFIVNEKTTEIYSIPELSQFHSIHTEFSKNQLRHSSLCFDLAFFFPSDDHFYAVIPLRTKGNIFYQKIKLFALNRTFFKQGCHHPRALDYRLPVKWTCGGCVLVRLVIEDVPASVFQESSATSLHITGGQHHRAAVKRGIMRINITTYSRVNI